MTSHHPKPHHHHPAPIHKEKKPMEATEFQPGDEVLVLVLDEEVEGVVRSVQLSKNLVDVQIYSKGHLKHCQTIAFPADEVKPRGNEKAASA
jgi:hypothetical protein